MWATVLLLCEWPRLIALFQGSADGRLWLSKMWQGWPERYFHLWLGSQLSTTMTWVTWQRGKLHAPLCYVKSGSVTTAFLWREIMVDSSGKPVNVKNLLQKTAATWFAVSASRTSFMKFILALTSDRRHAWSMTLRHSKHPYNFPNTLSQLLILSVT